MKIKNVNFDTEERGTDILRADDDWEAADFEIPPFLHKPPKGSRERNEMLLGCIDHRIEWLASRGLRPHVNVIARRTELMKLLSPHCLSHTTPDF